ncbi:MAG: PSD1 domain-containing protein [Verrucomicrobiae bacterium]|nr:PSD1 domain-containing protein [Verrucomicrobiae bacterium]
MIRRANLLLYTAAVWIAVSSGLQSADGKVSFSREILPLLSNNCFQCHGPDANHRKADLRLDVEEEAKKVRDASSAVVPGSRSESTVYQRLISTDPDEVMPPAEAHKTISRAEVELIGKWIDEGAEWGVHWAFTRIERPPAPDVAGAATAIDAFIRNKLADVQLSPSEPAERASLIRRLSLDLRGLPPTPDEVDDFVYDRSLNAYEKIVERYLDSPQYGERMAWEWLDAARYADSNGYQGDRERTMWPWRDWVVSALNRNVPWDDFTVWQLAGDLLPDATFEQRLATGFCRNHMINGEGGRIPAENRVDYVMDMSETAGTVWMALTVNCARCHDHKFDPLKQREYYELFAFFDQTPVDGGGGDPQTPPTLTVPSDADSAEIARLDQEIVDAARVLKEVDVATTLGNDPAARNTKQLKELESLLGDYASKLKSLRELSEQRDRVISSLPKVMVMADMEKPRKSFLLDRGLYTAPKEEVTAAVPDWLPRIPDGYSGNRLGLAKWLVSREHPLTARVTVNRFWQQFFGIGIVKTPEDFGVQGEFPVHPELLDWLAADFMDSGWDVKHLIRQIVTSDTYKQSSHATTALIERDPKNRLLAHAPRYRMPSWMIRDQALAAAGLLVPEIGGAPVKPYQPPGVWEDVSFGNKRYEQDKGAALYRRSIYTFWRRIIGPTAFFDSAARQVCEVKVARTNSPLHALGTLNDVTYVEAARALAERSIPVAGGARERIAHAFRLVLARHASTQELDVLSAAFDRLREEFSTDPEAAAHYLQVGTLPRAETVSPTDHAALAAVCLTILNLDEALNRE